MDATRNTSWWYQQWEDWCGKAMLVCSSLSVWISCSHFLQWSYGVTCWEVFSLGRTPYPGIGNHEILDHITSGERLKKPSLCPEKLYVIQNLLEVSTVQCTHHHYGIIFCHTLLSYRYGLICQCWHYTPEERPTFKEIVCNLQEYWDEEHLYEVQSYLPKWTSIASVSLTMGNYFLVQRTCACT